MDITIFQTRMRGLIESRGKYICDVAKDLGVSIPTLHRYLGGQRTPDLAYVLRIADYFNVSVDWLIGRTNDRFNHYTPEATEIASLYSSASEDDRAVVQAVLAKYKNKE